MMNHEVSKVEFEIIINPNFGIGIRDPEDTTISEALDNRYVNTQYFTIKWNNISLSINYGTQIAEGISDVIKMLEAIKNKEERFVVTFPSQAFFETWICKIEKCDINIDWDSRDDYRSITVKTDLFIKEWLKLLHQLRQVLVETGYNGANLMDFYLLKNLERFHS
ncbi:hypothetical protein ACVWXS_002771 [Lysinibacillus sp. TE18511]